MAGDSQWPDQNSRRCSHKEFIRLFLEAVPTLVDAFERPADPGLELPDAGSHHLQALPPGIPARVGANKYGEDFLHPVDDPAVHEFYNYYRFQ